MSVSRIAARYATPIIELAEEKNILDKVKDDMDTLLSVCSGSKDFLLMLKSPIIPSLTKASIVEKIFKGKVEDLTLNAFALIARKGRENLLDQVALEFIQMYNEKKGLADVTVTTSFEIDEELKKAFTKLAKEVSGKEPVLKTKIDPELLGGYILTMGDQQIDDSVRGQLKDLKLKFQNK